MNKYILTVLNSCIACLLVNLHYIKLYNFILYKDNNPIFPAMPLNRTPHCHIMIGPLDPPIQTCAPPTRAITQSVISGPGMLWKSPTNTSEGIAEELVLNILSTCMTGFFYTALFIGKFCCSCEYDTQIYLSDVYIILKILLTIPTCLRYNVDTI